MARSPLLGVGRSPPVLEVEADETEAHLDSVSAALSFCRVVRTYVSSKGPSVAFCFSFRFYHVNT